ncbi:uncharacterized protein PG998_015026 [Apiospora kogelbergensis]|uniref:uncharacterized protein n=1 Tax=Apiospora kogelbergensis TaxID=1337665 RepID=UPI003130AD4C
MSDGSGSDVTEAIATAQGAATASQGPTQFIRLMDLPIEIRHMIYGSMVTISRGPQSFVCYSNGHMFLTGLDLSFPWIATLSPDVFRYVMHPSRYQRISLDFTLLLEPPRRIQTWMDGWPGHIREHPPIIGGSYRPTGWFSAKHDTVEVVYECPARWRWHMTSTIDLGAPFGRIDDVYSVPAGATPYLLRPVPAHRRNSLYDVLDARVAEAIRDSQAHEEPDNQLDEQSNNQPDE